MSDKARDLAKSRPGAEPARRDKRSPGKSEATVGVTRRRKTVGEAGRGAANPKPPAQQVKATVRRIPSAERRALVLAKAADYFAEHGLEAQTRAIAEVCGVSQRLLYSLFRSKAELIDEVYNHEIAGIFKAIWFVNLKNRSVPFDQRLIAFYQDYYETLLTRRWLRLFLYSSLAGLDMAPNYANAVVTHALEIIVTEAAHDAGRAIPSTPDELNEVGWILHGAVSHLAIRRRIYAQDNAMPEQDVIAMAVRAFLASIPTLLPPLSPA